VDTSGGIAAGLAGRYATALFDLAAADGRIDAVERDLAAVEAAMTESSELAGLVANPRVGRADGARVMAAVAAHLGLDALSGRFLGVLAENRRLGKIAPVTRAFRALAAAHRGEVRAEVTSAHPLTEAQTAELKAQLRRRVGRDVALTTRIDSSILGGLIVRIGSQMIDSSIRTRLNTLAHAMKG
jgi:F-type H+-transporting ATPase subunit delta